MKAAFWILVVVVACFFIAILELRIVLGRPNKNQETNETPNIPNKNRTKDEGYIKYIMSNNPTVTRDDVVSFLSVVDVYDNTGSKEKALEAFDAFINQLASSNPMHAMMVNGFFCGLLGPNMSLSSEEIEALAKKNTPLIISKLNSQSK